MLMCLIAGSSRKGVMYNLHFILPRQNYPTHHCSHFSVSSNPLREVSSHFIKEQNGRKAKILLFREMGEKNLFSDALYTYNKRYVHKGQMIKVASPSSGNPLPEEWLLHVLSLSFGKKCPWADLLSWVKEDGGCWFKLEWNLLFMFGCKHICDDLRWQTVSWLVSVVRWWAFSPER